MKYFAFLWMIILGLGCGNSTVIDFDDLSTLTVTKNGTIVPVPINPGDMLQLGDIITETGSGIRLVVTNFIWMNDTIAPDGHVSIDLSQNAGGQQYELHFDNACLGVLDAVSQKIDSVNLKFADFGGNINLRENDTLHNVDNFTLIPSPTAGGLNIQVNHAIVNGNMVGTMALSGQMNPFKFPGSIPSLENVTYSFVVGGGQELWIDDLVLHH